MRIATVLLMAVLLGSCSQKDKEQVHDDAEKLRHDAREVAREAADDAKKAGREIDRGLEKTREKVHEALHDSDTTHR
jgi:hypothetical protein